jgi:hypothetical protein
VEPIKNNLEKEDEIFEVEPLLQQALDLTCYEFFSKASAPHKMTKTTYMGFLSIFEANLRRLLEPLDISLTNTSRLPIVFELAQPRRIRLWNDQDTVMTRQFSLVGYDCGDDVTPRFSVTPAGRLGSMA